MKVLIVSPCDLPVPAVCGGAVATLIESLIKVNETEMNMELTVFSSYDSKAECKSKNYPHTKFEWVKIPATIKYIDGIIDNLMGTTAKTGMPKEYLRKLFVIEQLKKLLCSKSYDAVVIQNSGYLLKVFRKSNFLEKYKGKIYYHLHNDIPGNADTDVLQHCKFLLISNYLKHGVTKLCGATAAERCYVVKNGINTQQYGQVLMENERLKLLKQLKIETDKKIIVYVGRIRPEKGLKELLDAIQTMNDPGVVLMIVGSTNFGTNDIAEFEKEIQEKCARLAERVVFTGFVQNTEVWKYYKLADVAVLPSMWEEPAGLTMIEAAASGIPVITTKSGGIPEYIDEKNAVLLKRDNRIVDSLRSSIQEILSNREKWKKKANYEQKYVCYNFSEEAFYKNFVDKLMQH